MASAEDIINSKLEALRAELASIEADIAQQEGVYQRIVGGPDEYERYKREAENLVALRAQVRLLEEIKEAIDKQHEMTQAHFLAIKDRDERSSRHNLWLTVTSSGISPIIG